MSYLTVTTKDGQAHEVAWCGVSFTNDLFIELTSETFAQAYEAFSDEENTREIIYSDTKEETVYKGYTRLQGIQRVVPSGNIRVDLLEEG